MASKSNSRDTATPQETDLNAGLQAGSSAVADITRQQMASTASTACAMLRAIDTFQQTQQHMIQRAALLQEQTAERLRSANTAAELMAINSTVILSSFSELAQYAQELMLASLKAQSEFMRPAEQQQQMASTSASAAGPIFQAWQSVFTAPMYGGSAFNRHH